MNIGLIAFSGTRVRTAELAELGVTLPGFVQRGKTIASLPSLGLLTVAGLTPRHHRVSYLEIDQLNDNAVLPHFDLVGLSSLSARIDDAYSLADRYRARGTGVIMGGLHVSRLPKEALQHCHSVVLGGAEEIWPCVLADAERGHLQPIYQGATDNVFTPELYAVPRFDLLQDRPYNRITIQTSRGCPRACEFCAASLTITKRFNQKPVATVLKEIRAARQYFPEPFLEFADDNTFLDKCWGKELLSALIPENLRWFTETDASIADDLELCDLLAASGCRQLLIGFESPQADDLSGIDPADWKRRQAPKIRRVIDTLQSRGVSVNGCFILGLDSHTLDIFPILSDFVRSSGLAEVQFTVLTPFPGTRLYDRFHREGRLLANRFWDRCTLFDVNYRPAQMTVEELESGLRWLFTETYSSTETARRTRAFVHQHKNGTPQMLPKLAP